MRAQIAQPSLTVTLAPTLLLECYGSPCAIQSQVSSHCCSWRSARDDMEDVTAANGSLDLEGLLKVLQKEPGGRGGGIPLLRRTADILLVNKALGQVRLRRRQDCDCFFACV